MAFSDAASPYHHEILVAAEELTGGQLLDLGAVDHLAVEFPVEIREVLVFAELGLSNPPLDGPLAAAGGRLAEDQLQEVQVGQPLLVGAGQRRVEDFGRQGNLERLGIVQDPLAKMLRRVRPGLPAWCRLFLRSGHRGRTPQRAGVDSPSRGAAA